MKRFVAMILAASLALCVSANRSAAAVVIGFGDPGHSTTGAWSPNNTGHNLNEHYQSSPANDATSTWDFTGLPNGQYYVAAAWYPSTNRTTEAEYAISDGGGTIVINQQVEPDPFHADGVTWSRLTSTPVTVSDGALRVTASDRVLDLYLMADAIRISQYPYGDPGIYIIDNDDVPGYTTTGNWIYERGTWWPRAFNQDEQYQHDPAGDHTATWSFTDLPQGTYRVSAAWQTHPNRTNGARYALSDGGGTVGVDQRVFTEDFTDGIEWQDLNRAVKIADGTLEVTLSDTDPAGYLMADSIRLELLGPQLTWDAMGDGQWGQIDGGSGMSRWRDEANNPVAEFPTAASRAVVKTNLVTVEKDHAAQWLDIQSGAVHVADGASLAVGKRLTMAAGTGLTLGADASITMGEILDVPAGSSLTLGARAAVSTDRELIVRAGPSLGLGDGATLAAGRTVSIAAGRTLALGSGATLRAAGGGSIDTITAAGSATLDTGGAMTVKTLAVGAGTFTKEGVGVLSLDNSMGNAVVAPNTTFKVAAGTLRSIGEHPLGGSTQVELAGGTLAVGDGGLLAGAMAYYSFNNSASPGNDDSGNGHAGALNNVSWTAAGKLGGGLAVNGYWGWMGANPVIDLDQQWTIASWYKGLAASGYRTLTRGLGQDHQILVVPDGRLGVWATNNGDFRDSGFNMAALDNNLWHHVVAVGSGSTTAFYIDGSYVGTSDRKSTADVYGIGNLQGGGQQFADFIDETIVYGRALSAGEIAALASATTYAVPPAMDATHVTVTASSTLRCASSSDVAFGPLTMVGGVVTTVGSGKTISFAGTTIAAGAVAVGFDPQVPTDYGTITNTSTQPAVTISKAGPGTWTLAQQISGQTSNVRWEVAGGTLNPQVADAFSGRPVTVSGGTLIMDGAAPLGASQVTLGGGALVVKVGAAPAGAAAYYSYEDPNNLGSDDSGNGHHGTIPTYPAPNNTQPVASATGGAIGGGLKLDTIVGRMITSPVVATGETWTIASWYKGLAAAGAYRTLSRGSATDHHLLVNPAGNLGTYLNGLPANQFRPSGFDMNTLDNSLWHHIVAVGSGTTTQYYIDGVLVGTADGKSVADVQMIGNIIGGGQRFADIIDETLVYARALDLAEITALYTAGVAGSYGGTALDMTGTSITVTGDSMLSTTAPSAAFGPLTLQSGIITTAGARGGMTFAGTTIPAGTTGTVGVNLQTSTDLGALAGNDAAVTFVKDGPQDLVLSETGNGLDRATLEVRGGVLVGYHGSNPFGAATLKLNGGNVLLSAKTGVASPVHYDNAIIVESNSTLTVGAGALGAAGPMGVVLGSLPDRGVTLDDGTLELRVLDGYTLDIAGQLNGPGGVRMAAGEATLSAGGSAGFVDVGGGKLRTVAALTVGNSSTSGGELNLGGDLSAGNVVVTGGVVNTNANQIVVGRSLKLGDALFEIDEGHSFQASGGDLLSDAAARQITLSGGALEVSKSTLPAGAIATWKFDEGTGSVAADTSTDPNVYPGNVMGAQWTNDPERGSVLSFAGSGDYVDVPSLNLTTGTITFAAWLNGHQAAQWAGIIMARSATSNCGIDLGGGNDQLHYIWNANSTWAWDGGPLVPRDQWAFVAVAIEPSKATAYVWSDGTLTSTENAIPHGPEPINGLEIGRDKATGDRNFVGLIDDVYIFNRALSADEIAGLLAASGGPLAMENTSFTVTEDSTLSLDAVTGDAVFGDLTLSDGVVLTVTGTTASVARLTAGNGATIDGSVYVRDTLALGGGLGTLTIEGSLELDDDATYAAKVGRPESDLVDIAVGDASLAGTLSVSAASTVKDPATLSQVPPAPSWGSQTLTIIRSTGEGAIYWQFADTPQSGSHVGHGVLFESVDYEWVTPGNPVEGSTAVTVSLYQAAPGDTATSPTLPGDPVQPVPDRQVNADDIQRILGETKFNSGSPADWSQGDFNDDGLCDANDIQLILASALFNAGPYGAAADGAFGAGLPTPPAAATAQLRVTPAGLLIDTAGTTINGYIVRSAAGVFTGEAADNLGLLQTAGDHDLSGQMFFSLSGTHLLGNVVGSEWVGIDLMMDLSMTYTVEGRAGIYEARVVVPEPGALILALCGALAALLVAAHRRHERHILPAE